MQTTSFKIAQYILFALVIILCFWIIIWTIYSNDSDAKHNTTVDNVIRITNSDPCVQKVNNTIYQLWAYNINEVPQKYLDMMFSYSNKKITTKTTGYCNAIKFTCKPGQKRKDCDPCANSTAQQFAMDQQIVDTIAKECN